MLLPGFSPAHVRQVEHVENCSAGAGAVQPRAAAGCGAGLADKGPESSTPRCFVQGLNQRAQALEGRSHALLQEVGVYLVPVRQNNYESPSSPPGVLYLQPSTMGFSEHAQVLEGRSHALLQEVGVDLVAILQEEGFYVRRRTMSAPLRQRSRDTFGTSAPIEVPTRVELDKLSERCGQSPASLLPASWLSVWDAPLTHVYPMLSATGRHAAHLTRSSTDARATCIGLTVCLGFDIQSASDEQHPGLAGDDTLAPCSSFS